ncbi:MAG: GFA family protein [Myxococcales bacterium]|nr:GFA family protein [Myxococcales bacterium]MCB9522863.1 GFA family protein [Myxococcales bacterium]
METFAGGCHCGRVRFEVDVAERTALECNCSICFKKGFLHLIVTRDRFRLQQGAGVLSTYRFNTGVARHTFCRHCGVQAFYTPRSHPDGVSVNLRCLDDRAAIAAFAIEPFDGQAWEASVDAIR